MKKILIIQTAYIGDVILATSLVEYIKGQLPECKIHFLLRKGNESLLEENPQIEKVWVWDKGKKFSSMFSIISGLREEKFDYTFNIQRFTNSAIFTLMSGANQKIGFKSNILSLFFSKAIEHKIPYNYQDTFLHEVQRIFLLIQDIIKKDIPSKENLKPKLYFTEQDHKKIKDLNLPNDYIVLAPASVWFTKQWPKDHWQTLLELLGGQNCYFIGAPTDIDFINRIIGKNQNAINLAGKLNLRQSALLMKDARRVIVNDSAPLHLASSVNAKTSALFCSTVPDFGYGPLSDDAKTLQIMPRLECMPCGLHGKTECPLGHFNCGHQLTPDQVLDSL